MGASRAGTRLANGAGRAVLAAALLAAAHGFAQTTPRQETRGAQSPNVYAPGGRVTIQYGVSTGELSGLRQGIADAVQREIAKLAPPQEVSLDLQEELKRRLETDRVRYAKASQQYKSGYELVQAKNFGDASLAFKTALEEVPDFFQALVGLARCYVELGRADAAKKTYLAALQLARERKNRRWEAETLVRLGSYLQKNDQDPEAQKYIDEGMKLAEETGYRSLVIVVLLNKRPSAGKFRRQLFWLVDMIYAVKKSGKPGPIALADLAEKSLVALGNYLEHGEGAGLLDLDFERYRSVLGTYYRDATSILDAPSEVDVVPRAFLFVVRSALTLGDAAPTEMQEHIDRAMGVLDREALKALRAGGPPSAPSKQAETKAAAAMAERDSRARARIDSVIKQYTRLLASQASRPDAHYQRGRFLLMGGRYAASLADLDRALELDPAHAAALYHRAIVKVLLNDLAGAREDYLKAVDMPSVWRRSLEEASAAAEAATKPDATKQGVAAAEAKLTEFLASKPDSADALLALARWHRMRGDAPATLELLARAKKFRPDLGVVDSELASVHRARAPVRLAAGDLEGATADLNAVLLLNPEGGKVKGKNGFQHRYAYSPAAPFPVYDARRRAALAGASKHYYQGFLFLLLGDGAKALAEFERVLKEEAGNPHWVDAAMNRAGILSGEERGEQALQGFNDVLARRGQGAEYAEAYLYRAYEHKRNKRNDLALQDLDRFLGLLPESANAASAHFERGLIHHSNNAELAVADYRKVLEMNAPAELSGLAQLNMGYLLEHQGKDDEALKQYDQLLELHPYSMDLLQRSAKLHHKRGNLDRALLRYNAIAEARWEPSQPAASAHARFNRARILRERGDREAAFKDFAEAIRLDPKSGIAATSHLNNGYIHSERKDREAAIRSYKAAIDLFPNYAEALNALAWEYATSGRNLEDALELAQRALKADPRPEYLDTLAEVHFARGAYGESRNANEAARAAAKGNEELTRLIDERAIRIDAHNKR